MINDSEATLLGVLEVQQNTSTCTHYFFIDKYLII